MKHSVHPNKKGNTKRRKGCPGAEKIASLFLEETPRQEKFGLLDHVLSCAACRVEFMVLKEIWRAKGSHIDPEMRLILDQSSPENIRTTAKKELKALTSQRTNRWRMVFSPGKTASLAAALIAFILLFYFIGPKGYKNNTLERNMGPGNFRILEPWNAVQKIPVVFRWTPVPEAVEYDVEILNGVLESIYRKEGIRTASFELPASVLERLSESKTYFWKVVATLKAGERVESEFGKFYLKEGSPRF